MKYTHHDLLPNPRERLDIPQGMKGWWGGAQWADSGGQAQIKEFSELASYNPKYFFKDFLRIKIIKYLNKAGFGAIAGSSRPKIERNEFN